MDNQSFNYYQPDSTYFNYLQQRQTQSAKTPDVYIKDNLFANLGTKGEFHMSFPDSLEERDKIFLGTIYEATIDHIVVHNESKHEWYLLPLIYLNYAVFKGQFKIPKK